MLDTLLNPRAIAVVGASHDERRPGGQALHALTHYGYAGKVYPVNPRYGEIHGARCHATVASLPEAADLAVIALPAAEVPRIIDECGAAGIRNAVVLSAGFRETGEAGAAVQAELDTSIRRSGVRVVGPNCVGVLNLRSRVFAGFGAGFRQPGWRTGPIAMISQSGGFAYSIVAYCQEAGIGIDYMVSTGNEADLGVLDFVEHFLEDDGVRLIAVYLEGLSDGRRLRALGRRALEVGKPIAVWKVGNTGAGQRAAVSHTANLTEEYDFYRDAFREGGFVEVREVYDLIDAAKVFRAGRRPRGRGVAIVTTSGGAGVLLADRCEEQGLKLPSLSQGTVSALAPLLPAFASTANPVDLTAVLAQKEPEFTRASELVVADPAVDLAILRSFPGRDVEAWVDHLVAYSATCDKPLLVSLSGTPGKSGWSSRLDEAGVACFEVPSRAAAAAAMLCDFAERTKQYSALPPPREAQPHPLPPGEAGSMLDEHEAKACLEAYGIRTPRRVFVRLDEALPGTIDLRFPVVVKIVSPDIAHKTEAGGVRLHVAAEDLPRVMADMKRTCAARAPGARLKGLLVEEMAEGVEMIVAALRNPSFGPLVVVGMGGIHAEVLRDVARRYAPVTPAQAREMILSLRGRRLLEGYRGQPARDIDAAAQAVSRLSWMIVDHEQTLAEIEINPLMVGAAGSGVIAVDALVRRGAHAGGAVK